MIAVDTNILIYAHRAGCPEHRAATAALERAVSNPAGWGISFSSLSEFWAQVTHPKVPGGPSTVDKASAFLNQLMGELGAVVFTPGPGFEVRLTTTARQLKASGHHIFDIQIALMALDQGAAQLWTHDKSMLRVPGLKYSDPIQR